jgi:spore maturation protein CgeB
MKITADSKILIISDIAERAYKYQYAFGCVPRDIARLGYTTRQIDAETLTLEDYKQVLSEFGPDLIFGYLQWPLQIIKIAGFLKEYHPVPAINWFLEDPNFVVSSKNQTNLLDATASYDYWFSQDARMQRFWKTRTAFMPPGFDDTAYRDLGLEKVYDVSYIGQLGHAGSTKMYWPYMKELSRYGRNAMLCIERPMGIPLLPKKMEKFIRSPKYRRFLQGLPFWKCGWKNPADEKEKCRIINQSKIHFGMVRVRGRWEMDLKKVLPDYPMDKHGLFYQLKGRLFQAVGAGTMALNEYCPELENMFEIGKEIVTFEFGNLEDLKEKLQWYVTHDNERDRIRKAGHARARKDHTFTARIRQILGKVRTEI